MPLLTAKELNYLLETAAYDKNSAIVLEENLSTQLAEKVKKHFCLSFIKNNLSVTILSLRSELRLCFEQGSTENVPD